MANQNVKPKAKLPVQQLSILAVARFAEPMAYTSVNPYLPEMIAGFGVEQNKVARWAGLTSAVFSLAQSATAVPWGKAADRYGRKPVLIFGLLSTMITFVIWGLSTSLPMAVTVRAIQGGGNGNVGIIRTMVAEMVTEKELQPRAFSVMPLVWSLGSIVGPSFGGFFADPAKQYPTLFGDSRLFTAFPYLLPNLVATIFFTISVLSAVFFLEETLSSKRGRGDWGLSAGKRFTRAFRRRRRHNPVNDASSRHRRTSFVDGEATAPLLPGVAPAKDAKPKEAVSASMSEVFSRQTVINLAAYTFLAFHSVAFDQNISVFLNYPVRQNTPDNTKLPFYFSGGFGLRSGEIGTIFAMYGIACGLIQFLLYPWLVTRFGVLYCMRVCSIALPVVYFLTPYTALFDTPTGRYIALGIVMLFKGFGVIIAFPSTTILLTNSASSLRILGTLNGFATMFSGLGRAFGPALTGLAFTWGADHGYILAPYAFLSAVAVLGAIPVFMIVEGDGPGAASAGDSTTDESDTDLLPDESAVIDEEDDEYEAEQAPLLNGNGQGPKYSSINGATK